ncbi:MAG: 4'-phosphopantetheinyl transferase superfamily protein [Candidatus Paceibacterota bacterium]|jgi:phosphopantetheine--protein transferase-like protein
MNIGVDLVAIKKFHKIKAHDYKHWSRVFSMLEWEYAFKDGLSASHLAGIFAAKEAAMKATGLVGVENYRKFEVRHDKLGAPKLNLKGSKLSLSHDQGLAIAFVLASTKK